MSGLKILTTTNEMHEKLLALCRPAVFDGGVSVDTVVAQIKQFTNTHADTPTYLHDVLEAIEYELEFSSNVVESRDRLLTLIKQISGVLIPEDILRFDLDVYGANELNYKQRVVKTKTRLFYKQLKFNMLREESEGYAKLITELIDTNRSLSVGSMLGRIHCLIGQFNLDPNRVVDITLECFEYCLHRRVFFIDLLKEMKATKGDLCHMLGFKYTFYQGKLGAPDSLYTMTAILCSERLVDLESLCVCLTPKFDQLVADQRRMIEEATKKAKRAEIVSSTVTIETSSSADGTSLMSGTAFAAVTSNVEGDSADDDEKILGENQKLGLTCALLEVGDWERAKFLLDRFPEHYAVNSSKRISIAIIDMIGSAIEPFYREKCNDFQLCMDIPRKSTSTRQSIRSCNTLTPIKCWTDFEKEVLPMIAFLGPNIAYRPLVMTMLTRLVSAFFEETAIFDKRSKDGSESTIPDELNQLSCLFVDLCDEVLLPSLSMADGNAALSDELWSLIGHFPYTLRYRLYGRWKNVHTGRHPGLLLRRGRVIGRTRYVIKRLSKETTKIIGRQIGKLSHVHPGIVFDYVLNQIQTFENLIGPVVESVKFLTSLEFDVLSYCIIEQLAAPEKQQLKASDASLSPWLQSLATFVGTAFKKYNMELTGVLQYVANQLKNDKSIDLLVLREVVQNMSGIESTSTLTQEQLEALAGGDLLRQEGGTFGHVKNVRGATNRLRDALFQEDLVVGLCILTAQQRACVVFKESDGVPLKLTGQFLDQCQLTLIQFGCFLSTNLKPDDYSKRMPTAPDLMDRYYLPADAAMFLARPIYINAINAKYDRAKKADRKRDPEKSLEIERKYIHYKAAFDQSANALIEELVSVIKLDDPMWTSLTPQLFVTFWLLTMYDLNVPIASYDRELKKVKKAILTVQDNADGLSKTKRTKDEERLRNLESRLADEKRRQIEHVDRIKALLRSDRSNYFIKPGSKPVRTWVGTGFMQQCILPRAIFSDMDAIYCARFIELLHIQMTTHFPTLSLLDRYTPFVAGLSENEANCFGRFTFLLLEMVMRWHSDKAIYDKECLCFPGFLINDKSLNDCQFTYDRYRSICHLWHVRITKSFCSMLDSTSYIQIRNALIVLIRILPKYPILQANYTMLDERVAKVRESEKGKRDDLSLMAASYAGHLKMRKIKLLVETEFHTPTVKPIVAVKAVTKSTTNDDAVSHAKEKSTTAKPTITPKSTTEPTTESGKRKSTSAQLTDSASKDKSKSARIESKGGGSKTASSSKSSSSANVATSSSSMKSDTPPSTVKSNSSADSTPVDDGHAKKKIAKSRVSKSTGKDSSK